MSSPDFSSIISGILSNPEMLSGIMNTVSALSSSGIGAILQGSQKNSNDTPVQQSANYDDQSNQGPSEGAPPVIDTLFEDRQNKSDEKPYGSPNYTSPHNSSSQRRALLYALKPFLGEKRGEKIDFILKVLALLDAAEGFNKFKQ